MLVDLVRITTRDGCQLDGILQRPENAGKTGIDVWCLVHGTGGNFYQSSLFDFLVARLLAQGSAVLRINTRGHDGISTAVSARGGLRLGAAYEIVDDCRHDLAGWVAWLKENVGPRVGLLGHSMGGLKCLYAAAHEAEMKPSCVVGISPPHLSYGWFCESEQRGRFLSHYEQAEKFAEAGKSTELIEVALPLPMVISAGGYLDKYGPQEKYNYLTFIAAVRCPILVLVGEIEVARNVAFQQVPTRLAELAQKRGNLAHQIIPGADHFYTGVRDQAWSALENWMLLQTF